MEPSPINSSERVLKEEQSQSENRVGGNARFEINFLFRNFQWRLNAKVNNTAVNRKGCKHTELRNNYRAYSNFLLIEKPIPVDISFFVRCTLKGLEWGVRRRARERQSTARRRSEILLISISWSNIDVLKAPTLDTRSKRAWKTQKGCERKHKKSVRRCVTLEADIHRLHGSIFFCSLSCPTCSMTIS